MFLPRLAVRRPIAILMVILMIVLLGVVSFDDIGLDLFPDMEMPVAMVMTSYGDAAPKEIESQVTEHVEDAVATVDNIDTIRSRSSEGSSMVIATFTWGTDMDHATLDMRENLGMITDYLPDDASDPTVFQFDPDMMPIKIISLSGPQELSELNDIAEDIVEPRIERQEGVASVDIIGGEEREIKVELDRTRLAGYDLTAGSVMEAIAAQNITQPGGTVERADFDYVIRTIGEFDDVDDIEDVLLPAPEGGQVRLADVAEVSDGFADRTHYNYLNEDSTIGIMVQKQSGTNTVNVAERVAGEVEVIENELPAETELITVMDMSEFIVEEIRNVAGIAAGGALLAMLLIFLFLRSFPSTLIIATAIPISIAAALLLIYFWGLTINLMTLGGIALAIGMLVDNAIVVLENIFRHRRLGIDRIDAAVDGAAQVGSPIIASTLTTLAVFLPVVYIEGLASEVFGELALTVSFVLIVSLAVSLSLIPMLSSKTAVKSSPEGKVSAADRAEAFQERMKDHYREILRRSLKKRFKVLISVIVLAVIAAFLTMFIGTEFFPEMDTGEVEVEFELPAGTSLEETKRVAHELEEIVLEYDDVENLYLSIGGGAQEVQFFTGEHSHEGYIYIDLIPDAQRTTTTGEMISELREEFETFPDLESSVDIAGEMEMGVEEPIRVDIKGDDLDTLDEIGGELTELVEDIEGTHDVAFSMEEGSPELHLDINRSKASHYGLTSAQIASEVRTAFSGSTATIYREAGEEVDVVVRLAEEDRETASDLEALLLEIPGGSGGSHLPVTEVADVELTEGPVTITREDQVRSVNVTADVTDRDLGSVNRDIEDRLEEVSLPAGYTVEIGGELGEMVEAFEELAVALILAIFLIYMVMAAQFESILHPFVIMFTVPLAAIGAVFGLFITGQIFSVPAFIGIIMLAGIVVNNAIVMVDYINRLRRREGMERMDAILEAAPIRLRPVLMTALSTMLAMIPLSIGLAEGAEAMRPLAVVVIGGLLFSTFLTLIVIPIIYTLVDSFGLWVKDRLKGIMNLS